MKFSTSVLFSLLCLFANSAAAETKIAVIADSQLLSESDLLTAELSKLPDIIILERTGIMKLMQEEKNILATTNNDAYYRVGKLAGADGLVILSRMKHEDKETLVSRLVAVSPGVVIDVSISPFPSDDIRQWVENICRHLIPLIPKLKVSRDSAVPISILNIRSPLDQPAANRLADQLTFLLSRRLILQKNIFVLDRWNLGKLTWEKELYDEDRPFWTGSYLLDGNIDLDFSSPDNKEITVNMRLKKADGETISFNTSGSRDNLVSIIDKIVRELTGRVAGKKEIVPWDLKEEAEQFFYEARWAYRVGDFNEACRKAESAYALGKINMETLMLLMCSYACSISHDSNLKTGNRYSLHPCWIYTMNLYTDKDETLDTAIKMMEVYRYFITSKDMQKDKYRFDFWTYIDANILAISSSVMRRYFIEESLLRRNENKIRNFRELVYECVDYIDKNGGSDRSISWLYENEPIHIPFLYPNPSAQLKQYYKLLTIGKNFDTISKNKIISNMFDRREQRGQAESLFRGIGWNQKPEESEINRYDAWLIDWEKMQCADNSITLDFSDKLRSSGDLRDNAIGCAFNIHINSEKYWEHKEMILECRKIITRLLDEKQYPGEDEIFTFIFEKNYFTPEDVKIFKAMFDRFLDDKEDFYTKNYHNIFSSLCYKIRNFSEEDAKLIIEKITGLEKSGELSMPNVEKDLKELKNNLIKKYPNLAKPEIPPSKTLKASFWHPALSSASKKTEFANFYLSNVEYKDGQISALGYLHSKEVEVTINPKKIEDIKVNYCKSDDPFFPSAEVGETSLMRYAIQTVRDKGKWDAIVSCSLLVSFKDGKKNIKIVLPAFKYGHHTAFQDLVFIYFRESSVSREDYSSENTGILEVNVKKGETRILCSSRRRPAVSPLDDIPQYDPIFLMDSGLNALMIFVEGFNERRLKCFPYLINTQTWNAPDVIPYLNPQSNVTISGSGFLIYDCSKYMFYSPMEKRKDLLPSPKDISKTATLPIPQYACLQDGNLWILNNKYGYYNDLPHKYQNGFNLKLLRKGSQEYLTIPLSFQIGEEQKKKIQESYPGGSIDSKFLINGLDMIYTDSGFVFKENYGDQIGFWFISFDEIKKYLDDNISDETKIR